MRGNIPPITSGNTYDHSQEHPQREIQSKEIPPIIPTDPDFMTDAYTPGKQMMNPLSAGPESSGTVSPPGPGRSASRRS